MCCHKSVNFGKLLGGGRGGGRERSKRLLRSCPPVSEGRRCQPEGTGLSARRPAPLCQGFSPPGVQWSSLSRQESGRWATTGYDGTRTLVEGETQGWGPAAPWWASRVLPHSSCLGGPVWAPDPGLLSFPPPPAQPQSGFGLFPLAQTTYRSICPGMELCSGPGVGAGARGWD